MDSLTTLERAKAWLAPDAGTLSSQNDALIGRLVPAVSRLALNVMGRDTLARTARSETYRGVRTGQLLLRHWPVISVESLTVAPDTNPMSPSLYSLEGIRPAGGCQRLTVVPGQSLWTPGEVSVEYTTGFVQTERHTLAAGATSLTVRSTWLQAESCALADGTPLTPVSAAAGVYTFASSPASRDIDVTYSYVPEDIEQAVIHEIGVIHQSRGRIGQSSKALPQGGGTVAYVPLQLSTITMQMLQSYTRSVPL